MGVGDGVQMENLSSFISNVIYLSLISKVTSNAAKNAFLTQELFDKVNVDRGVVMMYLGSRVDASGTDAGSDADQMVVLPKMVVCMREQSEMFNTPGHFLVADNTHCSPGYTKLVPLKLSGKWFSFNNVGCSIEDMLVSLSNGEECYLSSEKIVDFLLKIHKIHKKQTGSKRNAYRNGPCATFNALSVGSITYSEIALDLTVGIPLCYWPPEANEWLTRERKHGWPSKSLIDKIQRLPCYVVPVGDRYSSNTNIQWRVSFVLGERELLWSFNETQLHCLCVLKRLLSAFKDISPDELSSYQMKNILFWRIEKTDETFWCAQNLLHGIKMCLISFKVCVLQGELWHYIDRKRNLFRNKLQDENMRTSVLNHIDVVLNNIFESVMSSLNVSDLIEIWKVSQHNMETFLERCNQIFFTEIDDRKVIKDVFDKQSKLFFLSTAIRRSMLDINNLAKQRIELELSTEIDMYHKRVISDVIRVRLGIKLYKYSLEVTSSDSFTKGKLLTVSHSFLSSAIDLDGISGKLYLATFYLMTTDHYNSKYLIDSALFRRNKFLIYIGRCSSYFGILTRAKGCACWLEGCPLVGQYQFTQSDIAFDVIYGHDDVAFVPLALKFECIMGRTVGYITIHPLEYALYLAFCNCHQQQDKVGSKKYLKDLHKAVQENDESVHHTVAWTILGHCYSEVGDDLQAMACYRTSLEKTTPAEISNVALYHVIILIYKTFHFNEKGSI